MAVHIKTMCSKVSLVARYGKPPHENQKLLKGGPMFKILNRVLKFVEVCIVLA